MHMQYLLTLKNQSDGDQDIPSSLLFKIPFFSYRLHCSVKIP